MRLHDLRERKLRFHFRLTGTALAEHFFYGGGFACFVSKTGVAPRILQPRAAGAELKTADLPQGCRIVIARLLQQIVKYAPICGILTTRQHTIFLEKL